MDKVNLAETLALFAEHWSPKVVGEQNGQHVKLVKFVGEFVWHKHDHEDELFLVVKGRFRMDFRDNQAWLEEGEFLIVPRGVERCLIALAEDSSADPVIRSLLDRSVSRLQVLCASLLHRRYPRLTHPPLNLAADEVLGAVVKRLLKALREIRPGTVGQFFALANPPMRWERNDLARRLEGQPGDVERRDGLVPASLEQRFGPQPGWSPHPGGHRESPGGPARSVRPGPNPGDDPGRGRRDPGRFGQDGAASVESEPDRASSPTR
jgi:hypothetical protein